MYFETYDILKTFAALYPDKVEALTKKEFENIKFIENGASSHCHIQALNAEECKRKQPTN